MEYSPRNLPYSPASGPSEKSSPDLMRKKALRVLKSKSIPYDPMHALILCSSQGYTPVLIHLWEKMGMYEDALRLWMDRDNEGGIFVGVLSQLVRPDATLSVPTGSPVLDIVAWAAITTYGRCREGPHGR